MVQEGQSQEKAVWWFQVKIWSVAVISIALLSVCFILSCVETYHFTHGKNDKRLSELRTHHASLTCFNEGTRVTEKVWGCCPSTWKPFGSSCYLISNEENSWSKSEQNCVGMGAHLVVINTKVEQNFIVQQLNKSLSYFLGLSDPQKNDNWQWVDQTSYMENVRLWHHGEPNFPGEDCASVVFWNPRGWGWNDVFCDSKRSSICEMKKVFL
ncbi:PREDICTED: C-type lectin domain family 6 member A-like [Miniopterus natalensis]|uniref:C-type lectin domain family 6 member A-like n=1 Tax=Miniopterus natalensis TaxID=291302 RepID=UPI0007A6E942|nr:PREDICTED: C-type lectin domain family 6 member A-like [Miniopterus natalensis]